MKKALLVACAGILLLSSYSCRKNKTTNGNVVGAWKLLWYAEDGNMNGIIDSDEVERNYQYPQYSDIFTFNSNGTGTDISTNPADTEYNNSYTYTWTQSGDSLFIKYDYMPAPAHFHIDNINGANLQISYNNGEKSWWKFARQ